MNIEYKGLNHASVLVQDLQISLQFYEGLLGLTLARRPDKGFKGAWLQVGEEQIHLLELPNPDPLNGRPEHVGRDRHVALTITELQPLIDILNREQIVFTKSKSDRAAIFFRDPDGNGLEFVQMQA